MKVHFESVVEADSVQEALNILKESIDKFVAERNVDDKFIFKLYDGLEFRLNNCWNAEKLTLEAYIDSYGEQVKGDKNEID